MMAPLPRAADFSPPRWLRNAHLQSMLNSSSLRRATLWSRTRMLARVTRAEVLQLDGGVRLQGFLSTQTALSTRRGLVLLLHGWEGSADSNYMLATCTGLLRAGYDVYRLNFRDHGDSHALNPEPFHSCLLDEVIAAAARVCARPGAGLRAIAGFSLGGNFALRVARDAPAHGLELHYAFAVCPVVDPAAGLRQLEQGRLYHAYFLRKWRASLRRKQALFPSHALVSRAELALDMRGLTRALVLRHTGFGTLDAYLDGYSIAGDRLAALRVPTTILTAADDPVIAVANFRAMQLPDCVELDIATHGGHCGFLTGAGLHSFVEDYLIARLAERAAALALTPARAARRA
jgi:predicted alpha/beta-fold hydrolase